jgi:FkbM family methyltransferase
MCKELLLSSLTMQSALYNLPEKTERQKSNQELANLFANIVANSNIDSFYEIGALYAEFSMYIKNRVGEVFAFEASPRNYNLGKENIDGIEYLNVAVSNYDGEITINVGISENANIGADSVLDRIDNGTTEYKKETVECLKLDTFINSKNLNGKTNALWIDVEGSALDVLEGAKENLLNTKAIFIEMEQVSLWKDQNLVADINKYLCDFGFVPIARDFEYENQFNVIYVKEEILYKPEVDISLQMFYAGYATRESKYVQKI